MAETTWSSLDFAVPAGPIDCACVIHGQSYSWNYVERLYSMLDRHITRDIRLHVYTEPDRAVPANMIKHELTDWQISGPKKSWWYKIQLFDDKKYQGPLLYFDLDVVITGNIDWIWQSSLQYFWTLRDFNYLWRPTSYKLNSSVMWFNTLKFSNVYQNFVSQNMAHLMRRHHGDQDYLTDILPRNDIKFLDPKRIQSWRWQALDGGFDFMKRTYNTPGSGTQITPKTSVLIFHGKPKPAEVRDPAVIEHWQ